MELYQAYMKGFIECSSSTPAFDFERMRVGTVQELTAIALGIIDAGLHQTGHTGRESLQTREQIERKVKELVGSA